MKRNFDIKYNKNSKKRGASKRSNNLTKKPEWKNPTPPIESAPIKKPIHRQRKGR